MIKTMTRAGALATTMTAMAVTGCSSSGKGQPAPARSSITANPCAALAGTPVGREVDASNPSGGHLAVEPKACANAADLSSSQGCYPAGTSGVGDLFWYTLDGVTAVGRPGGKWVVIRGEFARSDASRVGC